VSDPGSRALVVDDEAGIRRFLRASLEAHGYSIHETSTGEETLQVVPAFRPDLIHLDLGLPGFGGKQVTSRLRGLRRQRLFDAVLTTNPLQ
jgi:two-component system KDP operon response regulator KdpE